MIPLARPMPSRFDVPRLSERVLRASPAYDLVPHHTLPRAHRATFAPLAQDPDHFGLLVPSRRTELGVKAVDRGLAALFTALREPRLPGRQHLPGLSDHTLLRLVVDGILELETELGFASGPGACEALELVGLTHCAGPLAQCSRQALHLAYHHPTQDPGVLSAWIYRYGTLPADAAAARAYAQTPERCEGLGIHPGSRRRGRLSAAYHHSPTSAWSSWQRPDRGPLALPYKLYISPHPNPLGQRFGGLIDALVDLEVPAFKFGLGLSGMLRPDRMVVYLESWAQLRALAVRLASVLGGAEAHGVPFTAALDAKGCLSWGMDPPRQARIDGWGGAESWRSWVTNRAARGLLVARSAGCNADTAVRFAMTRLMVEGVDIATWTPRPRLWDTESSP